MTDLVDRAQDQADRHLADALMVRKPVPTKCERCSRTVMTLPNGARCRFCEDCLADYEDERAL